MDARTYIETQVVGSELQGKRRAAAEARQARQARQRSKQQAEGTMEARGRGRLWNGLGRYPTARQVVAAVIAVLLAVALVGQVMAQEASGTAWRGRSGPRKHLVVKPGQAGENLALRGGKQRQRVAVHRSGALQLVSVRPTRRAATM